MQDLVSVLCKYEQMPDVLVFPAASSPSMRIRISFVPKTLFIIFDIDPPILGTVYGSPVDAIRLRSRTAVEDYTVRPLGKFRQARTNEGDSLS